MTDDSHPTDVRLGDIIGSGVFAAIASVLALSFIARFVGVGLLSDHPEGHSSLGFVTASLACISIAVGLIEARRRYKRARRAT
jgi:hypothetical protein